MALWWKLLSRRIREASTPLRLASLTTEGSFHNAFGTSSRAASAIIKFSFKHDSGLQAPFIALFFRTTCVKARASAKAEATAAAESLVDYSVKTSANDLALAKRQMELARKVMLRFNVRLDPSRRRFICRGCKKLIVPGVNARVRLGKGKQKVLRITCQECGRVNRKILSRP